MNETIIIVLVIGVPFFLFSQIKFIIRLIKRRRNPEYIPRVLFSFEGICEMLLCFGQCCGDLSCYEQDRRTRRRKSDIRTVKKEFKEQNLYRKTERRTTSSVDSNLDEKTRIINSMADLKKVSLIYISNRTSIPIDRVAYILAKDPNYLIQGNFVIDRSKITYEELGETINVIGREQDMRNLGEGALADGICSECFSFYEQGTDFCPNCGSKLNK